MTEELAQGIVKAAQILHQKETKKRTSTRQWNIGKTFIFLCGFVPRQESVIPTKLLDWTQHSIGWGEKDSILNIMPCSR